MALADFITTASGGVNYRVTHIDDIVPRLPPDHLEFSQFSPEYWITSANNVTVTIKDITVVVGIDSKAGNAGTTGFDIPAHSWYFGRISSCS
jgi:hypothetical protein